MADLTNVETSSFAAVDAEGFPEPDLDTTGSALDEAEALIEDMLRAVLEREGVLYWAPDQTLDLHDYLEKGMRPADIAGLQARITALFDDDPRYVQVVATVTQSPDPKTGKTVLGVVMAAQGASGVSAELQLQQDGVTWRFVRLN